MTLEELIKLARIRLRARNDQTLWTDDDLTEFANSAVEEACIRARLFEAKTQVNIVPGIETYTLPYPVYEIDDAFFLDYTGALVNAGDFIPGQWYVITTPGTTSFISIGATDNLSGTVFQATGVGSGTGAATKCNSSPISPIAQSTFFSTRTRDLPIGSVSGRPVYIVRGSVSNQISILPLSDIVGTIVFHGRRLPGPAEKMVNPQDEPVIPVEFHRDLVHWMVAEAYNVHDSDALDPGAAEKYEAKFEARFGKRPSAKAEAYSLRAPVGGDIKSRRFGSTRPCR